MKKPYVAIVDDDSSFASYLRTFLSLRGYEARCYTRGDELLMIAMSGETVIDWAIKFKQQFASVAPMVWVAGYCNDMYGYVPTKRILAEGGYEGGRATLWSWMPAPFTDEVEDRLTAAVQRLVERTG